MRGVEHRPDEGDRHGLDTLLKVQLASRAHIRLLHRRPDRAIGNDPLADTFAQIARHQHGGGGIFRIVAEAIFLVAIANLDRVLMARRTDEAGLAAAMGDQRVEADRRAVDAEIAVGHQGRGGDAEIVGDQFQAVLDGLGRIGGCGKRLEQPDVTRTTVGDDEIGEGAAGIDAETILRAHGCVLLQAAERKAWVAWTSTSRVSASVITTP